MCGRYYEIRSMSEWYASYWNAFLFKDMFTRCDCDCNFSIPTNGLYGIHCTGLSHIPQTFDKNNAITIRNKNAFQ